MLVAALVCPGCGGGGGGDDGSEVAFPYIIGPSGHWAGVCSPDPIAPITGCVTGYTVRPGHIDVTVDAIGVPAASAVTILVCRTGATCVASEIAKRPTAESPTLFHARVPLPNPDGVSQLCASAMVFAPKPPQPPGTGSGSPYQYVPLGCERLDAVLRPVAGRFRLDQTREGILFAGWLIDVSSDQPGRFRFSHGMDAEGVSIDFSANAAEERSLERWPGFSAEHGFTAVLPYDGKPGTHDVCLHTLPPSVDALPVRVHCFRYEERTELFISEASVTQGTAITASVKSVGPGTDVALNLRSEGGYFVLPWTHESLWRATAGPQGEAEFTITSTNLPPGNYNVAFHCSPECPGGTLDTDELVGGEPWTGRITFGPRITVRPAGGHALTLDQPSADLLRLQGNGFQPGEPVRVVVVPNLRMADGPPHHAFAVAYANADSGGAFAAEAVISHLPRSELTQVIAFDKRDQPVVSALFSGG